jgi:hypothetical protein
MIAWNQLTKVGGPVVTVIGGGWAVVKAFFFLRDELQKWKQRIAQGYVVPGETLRIARKNESFCWWHMGAMGSDPTMQVVAEFYVSNIYDKPVRIAQAELHYGFWGRKSTYGHATVPQRPDGGNYWGRYDIPPNESRDATIDFWVYPPIAKENTEFRASSISLFDQFGNRHRIRKVTFGYR